MKMNKKLFAAALLTPALLINELAAEDQPNQTVQEQSSARQHDAAKELKRQQDLKNVQRDSEIDRLQKELDRLKQQRPELSPTKKPEAFEIQRQLDELRNDQQMQRLMTDQQLDRIERERDPARQQQQIDDLQRRQRLESLQDQMRRNQTEQQLERFRQQPTVMPGSRHIPLSGPRR
jgi:hypothetical protein